MQAWLSKLREVVRSSVGRAVEAGVDVRVLTGSWQHDLDQARQLEDIPGVQVKVTRQVAGHEQHVCSLADAPVARSRSCPSS